MRPGPWAALVVGIGLAAGCAGGPRAVPPNAVQPPGASFEGQPFIGRAQKIKILEDVAHDTFRRLAETPLVALGRGGRKFVERVFIRAIKAAPPSVAARLLDRGTEAVDGGIGGPAKPARLTFLDGSEAAIDGLLGLIAGATWRIDLMMYGWQDDPTGRQVAAALADRARRGVRVRLLVDKASNVIHNPSAVDGGPPFLNELARTPNVTLVFSPDAGARFDHRKLAVVDGRVAWSGSMILTEVARRRWRNFSYLAEGPIVEDLAAVFAERWSDVGQPGEPPLVAPGALAIDGPPNASVRRVGTDVDGERTRERLVYHAADHARHHIYLTNPYFSDELLVSKLIAARRRGVDVRVILTLRGNVERMNRYSAMYASRLFRAGVRVYLYPAMTHVKAMSADGDWALVGTGNFDELSLRNNREVGLSITGPAVAEIDRTLFLRDMADSEELHAPLPPPRGRLALRLLDLWF